MASTLTVSERKAIREELRARYVAHKGIEFAERVVAFCDDSEAMESAMMKAVANNKTIEFKINLMIEQLKGKGAK